MSKIKDSGLKYSEDLNIREVIQPYLKRWKFFVISILSTISLTIFYIKKTEPVYEMRSTVMIKDTKKSALDFGMMSELSSFGGRSSSTINNEMELLKSKRLMKEVVEVLGIQTKIFEKKGILRSELYGKSAPFIIKVVAEKKIAADEKIEPVYVKMNGDKLELTADNFKDQITTTFNKTISLPFANLMILKNPEFDRAKTKKLPEISFIYSPVESEINALQRTSDISLVDKDATVVGINIKYSNIEKGKAIINSLINAYNDDAINDKNSESKKTKEFIDERLSIISTELGEVESEKENFKTANQITDITTEAGINLGSSAATRAKLVDTEVQLNINNDLISYMSKQGSNQILPSTVGLSNPTASSNIMTYNELVMQRNTLLENATPQNPTIVELTKQIANVRSAIMDNLIKNRTSLNELKNQMTVEQNILVSKIRKVPAWEKTFRNIERQQSIKENLYLILLQKREETAILLANTTPKAKILDYAFPSEKPISPKKIFLLAGALMLGLFIPFMYIYLKGLLNNKMQSRDDLEKLTSTTILGELPSLHRGESETVLKNDLSPKAEAFRILITNMNFLLPKTQKGKIVIVTSSVKGEGKTFVALNLALTLATSSLKVIIVGVDIRNPQLQRYNVERKESEGLTEYLYDDSKEINDIINSSAFNPHCDMIYSGSIPPNPTELLTNGRLNNLVEKLKPLYDYIILDTAPLMLVTDTLLFSDVADATVYVTRSKYTEKALIGFANTVIDQNKIKNVGFVINDVRKENFSYGNKYGYGYNVDQEKKWWQFYKS
ncbi:GumC family protein [Kaistella sp.]|uniref:GumC family protein n=1 Tax=Kaistella sp. TaxID=2782235 RepID=UPI0035A1733E